MNHYTRQDPLVRVIKVACWTRQASISWGWAARRLTNCCTWTAYPAADSKVQVRHRQRQCGGLTGTALVAAARLGCRCAIRRNAGRRRAFAVRPGAAARRGGSTWNTSAALTTHSRCTRWSWSTRIAHTPGNPVRRRRCRARRGWPPEEVIRAAQVLFVDHFGVEGMLPAVDGPCGGIPVVADLESCAEAAVRQAGGAGRSPHERRRILPGSGPAGPPRGRGAGPVGPRGRRSW